MKFIPQDAIDNAVLFKLFLYAQTSDKRLDKEQIAKLFSFTISTKRVDLALDNLAESGKISRWINSGSCSIERDGYKFVEENLRDSSGFLTNYARNGDEWLQDQSLPIGGVPASDRVVLRSDNQDALQRVTEQIDIICDEMSSSNEIGDALGTDKEVLQGELAASKKLASAPAFRLQRLLGLILPCLRYLSEKFSGAAIGEAAKQLIKLLMDLL